METINAFRSSGNVITKTIVLMVEKMKKIVQNTNPSVTLIYVSIITAQKIRVTLAMPRVYKRGT